MYVTANVHMTDMRTGQKKIYEDSCERDANDLFNPDDCDDPRNEQEMYAYIVRYWTESFGKCDSERSLYFFNFDPKQQLPRNEGENIIRVDKITIENIMAPDDGDVLWENPHE